MCTKRSDMPQVDWKDYPGLFKFLHERDVNIAYTLIRPERASPIQCIRLPLKRMTDPAIVKKPTLISIEPKILDGNHRWATLKQQGRIMPAYRIDLPFEQALALLWEYPATYTYGDGAYHPKSF